MSNTPFAYAVCSVLHRSVEFKANSRPSLVSSPPLPSSQEVLKGVCGTTTALSTKSLSKPPCGAAFC